MPLDDSDTEEYSNMSPEILEHHTSADITEREELVAQGQSFETSRRTSESHTETDTDDDYCLSDEDDLSCIVSNSIDNHHRVNYASSITEHVAYLSNSLSHALDSINLDKSLVVQAQLSGQLNNEKQKLIDKRQEVIDKLTTLKRLYSHNFALSYDPKLKTNINRVGKLKRDIRRIESRVEALKMGSTNNTNSGIKAIFTSKNHNKIGLAQRYPIEYNQAKDKVLERQIDEIE